MWVVHECKVKLYDADLLFLLILLAVLASSAFACWLTGMADV